LLAGTPFILAIMRLFSVRAPFLDDVWPPKKLQAFALVGVYVGAFSVFMYMLTRDQYFIPGEQHFVCVVDYKFFEHGGICPTHGKPLQEVTPDIVEIVQGVKKHGPPHAIALGSEGPFVNAATGQPAVWFGERDGMLVPYNGPGFDPIKAVRLQPATQAMVARYRNDLLQVHAAQEEEAARREQERRAAAQRGALLAQARALAQRLERDPGNADLAYRLGQLYAQAGDRGKAIESFKKALWIDPTMDEAKAAIRRLGGRS
jgi:tetratricopeptide repeat protein